MNGSRSMDTHDISRGVEISKEVASLTIPIHIVGIQSELYTKLQSKN